MNDMKNVLDNLKSSHILAGDATHAYRDPAVLLIDGTFYIYMTLVETEPDGTVYMYVAHTRTRDLVSFTPIEKLTVRDRAYNFSSPGNIVFHDGRYIMCLQTYCRENGEKYGNARSRIYMMESSDLVSWGEPYPIPVKGDLPIEECGRMIDPYLIYDEKLGLWNCFYKQSGVSRSVSRDLVHFEYRGRIEGGENVSILPYGDGYYMFHSPRNGIGVKFSRDLENWEDTGTLLTFGQSEWSWAMGRITAGVAVKAKYGECDVYIMFFHGTGPEDERVIFDTHAGLGVAWSFDLSEWHYR